MKRISFNDNWMYAVHTGDWQDRTPAQPVTLPHDAMIGTERKPESRYWFQYGGFTAQDAKYTKTFIAPEEWLDRTVLLEFEGVYYDSTVTLNGHVIARQEYGYSRFLADCSPYLKAGENTLEVLAHAGSAPNSRWYPGTGIYRDVWLLVSEHAHIAPWGVRVTTDDVFEGGAQVRAEIAVENRSARERELVLCEKLIAPDGTVAAHADVPVAVRPGCTETLLQHFVLKDPALWSPETPALWHIEAHLLENGKEIDAACDRFGVRKVTADPVRGFCVNGKSYKLRGGCIHHDNGPIGTAEYKTAAYRRVKMMKDAGYNAIRSSHNPMSPALLESCDELGVLVMDESFDTWNIPKTSYDYNLFFAANWQKDIASMIAKDYNHPCVVMYSIGNEISERDGSNEGGMWARRQAEYVRSLDPTRPVTSAICGINDPDEEPIPFKHFSGEKGFYGVPYSHFSASNADYFIKKCDDFANALDVMSLNYVQASYERLGETRPNRLLCGTESMVAQYGEVWDLVEKHPYIAGDFCWTAWEYLGEAGCGKIDYIEDGHERALRSFMGDYPWIMSYCGDFDLTGMRRTQSYYREIVWKLRKAPYIAVQRPEKHGMTPDYTPWSWSDTAASWTWPGYEGKEVDVEVYADADEAELFVNGVSQGRQPVRAYGAVFTCVYQPGSVKTVVYRGGVPCGEWELATCGAPVALKLTAETGDMLAGGKDVSYIRVEAVDADGNKVYCRPGVKVRVDGAAVLAGYASGDPMTARDLGSDTATLFDGTAIAVVRSTGAKGAFTLTAESEGLKSASVTLEAK